MPVTRTVRSGDMTTVEARAAVAAACSQDWERVVHFLALAAVERQPPALAASRDAD